MKLSATWTAGCEIFCHMTAFTCVVEPLNVLDAADDAGMKDTATP